MTTLFYMLRAVTSALADDGREKLKNVANGTSRSPRCTDVEGKKKTGIPVSLNIIQHSRVSAHSPSSLFKVPPVRLLHSQQFNLQICKSLAKMCKVCVQRSCSQWRADDCRGHGGGVMVMVMAGAGGAQRDGGGTRTVLFECEGNRKCRLWIKYLRRVGGGAQIKMVIYFYL